MAEPEYLCSDSPQLTPLWREEAGGERVNISQPIFQMSSEEAGRFCNEHPTVNNGSETTSFLQSGILSPLNLKEGTHCLVHRF